MQKLSRLISLIINKMFDKRHLIQMLKFLIITTVISTVQTSSPRWEPQIAVLCEGGQVYQPQYLSEDGLWVTDLSNKASTSTCLRDKLDLLDYCKKAYPNRDITNIVESSHYQKIGSWCRQSAVNAAKCKGSHRWIKPFRCLEGPFQSDALLVPEGCLFDHIHNASRCWPFIRWNQTGAAACQERGMQMRSFAMLLPCGISLFSGVEFVCCPKHFKIDDIRVKKTDLAVLPRAVISTSSDDLQDDDDNDDDDDDDDDDDIDDDDDDVDLNYSKESGDDGIDDDIEDDFLANDEDDEMSANEIASNGDDIKTNEYDSTNDNDNNYDEGGTIMDSSNKGGSSNGAKIDVSKTNININKADLTKLSNDQKTNDQNLNLILSVGNLPQLPPTTGQPTPDPYFTHFDPHYEHQSYKVSEKEAQQRLEESHREKVTRVMKDWSDLEEKYQDMRLADPKAAQSFKQRMTARFQTSVQALEEEGNAEKHQLAAIHQQRVLAHINQRKREAMTCYTQALTEQPPNAHHVEKCLQKLLRALHKDRAHALAHYRHLLNSGGTGGLEAAASERPRTLERLIDIDRAVNQSMTMLKRYPELSAKISQLMNDYILALRSKDDIPGSSLGMSEEAETTILNKYRVEIERKVAEKERLRLAEKQRKEQRAVEREKLRKEQMRLKAQKVDDLLKSEKQTLTIMKEEAKDMKEITGPVNAGDIVDSPKLVGNEKNSNHENNVEVTTSGKIQTVLPTVDDEAVQRAVEDVAAVVAHQDVEPKVQHFLSHDLVHHESGFSLRREYGHATMPHPNKEGRNVYFTLSFAGIALIAAIFVGVAVAKWRTSRSPHGQGFIEVEQNTTIHHPIVAEDKILPNMQINGYENPTYKYFEVKE